MSISAPPPPSQVVYPDSDGKPMADNTLQFQWISLLKWELDALFADDPEVFVAGDLLWYPVEGDNRTRLAPDVLVAFGRPKGYRGSYRQWEEGGIAPQVVFEVLSPGNRLGEMSRKFEFFERYGALEYYVYDPDDFGFTGWHRDSADAPFRFIDPIDGWTSPLLGVRFEVPGDREMTVRRPDGTPFRSPLEVRRELERAQAERDRVTADRERLAAKLRELGIDPDAV